MKELYLSYSKLNEKTPIELVSFAATANDMDYIVDTIAVHIQLDFQERQLLLETASLKDRLLKLCGYIKKEIETNGFREDLYHRLSVILINVPSLNEREDDIPILAEYFNNLICNEYGMSKKIIKKDAIDELQKIQWTGNIREFRNVLERLIILCPTEITGIDVLTYAKPVSGGSNI